MRAVLLVLLFFNSHHRVNGGIFKINSHNITKVSCHENRRIEVLFAHDWGNNRAEKVKNVLEKCNGHNNCNVSNPTEESIQGIYSCWHPDIPILEIKKSSTVKQVTNSSKWANVFLMSENYLKGEYMDAQNTYCHLRYIAESKEGYANKTLSLEALEFSPFINTSKFCLRLQNLTEPVICSGSWKVPTHKKYYYTKGGWQFRLTLGDTGLHSSKVRFWIYVEATLAGNVQLECISEPAKETSDPMKSPGAVIEGTWSKTVIPVIAILGGLCIVFTVTFMCLIIKFKRLPKQAHQTTAMPCQQVDQPIYDEIKVDSQCQASNPQHHAANDEGYLLVLPTRNAKWSRNKP